MSNDLISRKALVSGLSLMAKYQPECKQSTILGVCATIKAVPAVDAEPVRHGRCLPTNDDNKKRCSECDVIHLIAQYPHGQANYYPNCGAKMDGGKDNADN